MKKLPFFSKRLENRYKYYSFLNQLGEGEPLVLDDCKLPALSAKHAVRMYTLLRTPKLDKVNVSYNFNNTPLSMRRVLEFEAVSDFKKVGHTVLQFKFVQNYNVDFV